MFQIILDYKTTQVEKQFVHKKDIIKLAIKNGTIKEELKENFNCAVITNGPILDIEILDIPNNPIDLDCYPCLRIYTYGTTINKV